MKKTAYVTPFILTMNVSLAAATAGSAPRVDQNGDFSGFSEGGSEYKDESKYKDKDKDKDNNGNHYGWFKDRDDD